MVLENDINGLMDASSDEVFVLMNTRPVDLVHPFTLPSNLRPTELCFFIEAAVLPRRCTLDSGSHLKMFRKPAEHALVYNCFILG